MTGPDGQPREATAHDAQLTSALANMSISLTANCFIAASAAMIVFEQQRDSALFVWLGFVVLLNIVRLIYGRRQAGRTQDEQSAQAVLRKLTVLALVGGLAWVPLPAYFISTIDTATAAYIVFILSGIATGAIIQSLAYWRISVAFGAPILTVVVARLLLEGQAIDLVVAMNVLLLMTMLLRIAILSEASFKASYFTTLEAIELAASLKSANDEVQKANDTLKKLASTDTLTGLANRSVFNQLLSQTTLKKQPVCLALIDLDHFKQINDSYGHQKGDEILCSLALLMLADAEDDLTPIRLAGDEFAIIGTGRWAGPRLLQLADALRSDFAALRKDDGLPHMTLSIGICIDDAAQMSAAELFAEADRMLYQAKADGRNCIRVSETSQRTSRARKVH